MRQTNPSGISIIAAGMAIWLGFAPLSTRAQLQKTRVDAASGEKPSMDSKSLPRVSLLNLQVIKPDPSMAGMPAHMRNQRRFGFPSAPQDGTTLVLLVEEPQQWILSLETKDSKVTKFCDERGTDLAQSQIPADERDRRFNPQLGPEICKLSGEVDAAGHRATVTVHSPGLPADGASRLSLEADLVMKLGHGEKIVEQKNVNLKRGAMMMGPMNLIVMAQEPIDGIGQGNFTQVIFIRQGPIEREIKKVAFIADDGSEIQVRGTGGGNNGSFHQAQYHMARQVENCTIRLTVPERIETVTLSFALDTGVGFPPGARRRSLRSHESRGKVNETKP